MIIYHPFSLHAYLYMVNIYGGNKMFRSSDRSHLRNYIPSKPNTIKGRGCSCPDDCVTNFNWFGAWVDIPDDILSGNSCLCETDLNFLKEIINQNSNNNLIGNAQEGFPLPDHTFVTVDGNAFNTIFF